MEQVAIQQVSTVALWLGFAVGLLARWGDRMQHIISDSPDRTWRGYLKHNWGRLVLRLGVTAYTFHLMLGQGWVVSEVIAFSTGVSADTLTESFVDRAKKQGEQRWATLRSRFK